MVRYAMGNEATTRTWTRWDCETMKCMWLNFPKYACMMSYIQPITFYRLLSRFVYLWEMFCVISLWSYEWCCCCCWIYAILLWALRMSKKDKDYLIYVLFECHSMYLKFQFIFSSHSCKAQSTDLFNICLLCVWDPRLWLWTFFIRFYCVKNLENYHAQWWWWCCSLFDDDSSKLVNRLISERILINI